MEAAFPTETETETAVDGKDGGEAAVPAVPGVVGRSAGDGQIVEVLFG